MEHVQTTGNTKSNVNNKGNHQNSFKDFLKKKKRENNTEKKTDWMKRKKMWVNSIKSLYEILDKLIVSNFKDAGYSVTTNTDELKITEDYLGSYYVQKYIINADNITITLNPIGSTIIGAYGRVDMLLPNETIKLVMPEWDNWKIVKGIGGSRELIDLNEANVFELFKENL